MLLKMKTEVLTPFELQSTSLLHCVVFIWNLLSIQEKVQTILKQSKEIEKQIQSNQQIRLHI